MTRPLEGRVAVVTGGGRGIGRAVALALAEAGAKLAICARSADELGESARLIDAVGERTRGGINVALPSTLAPTLTEVCDVADAAQVERFAGSVLARLGTPYVVVNNAGIVHRGRLDEQPPEDWRAVVDVNLHGTYLVTRAFLPALRRARSGRIINIASISGRQGTPQLTAYCAAKHAVVGLTRALAEEVRDDGIQVNAICPGSVDTRMLEGSPFSPAMTPGDIARVALFLAGDAPAAMTGACLDVFG